MMHCKLKDTAEILEEIVHLCSEIQPCQEFSRRPPWMSLSYEICIPARNVLEDFAFGFYFATFKAEQLECSFIWEVNLGRGVRLVLCQWSKFWFYQRHRQKDLRVLPRSRIIAIKKTTKMKVQKLWEVFCDIAGTSVLCANLRNTSDKQGQLTWFSRKIRCRRHKTVFANKCV